MVNSNYFSPEAEKAIIRELLGCYFFRDPAVNKRLAYLPGGLHEERINYICDILDCLLFPKRPHNFFGTFRNLDAFLAASGKRAHFIHTFEVFMLGFVIISKICHDPILRDKCFGSRGSKYIFNTWLLTSSTHDLGRPLEVSSDIAARLALLYRQYHLDNTAAQFDRVARVNLVEEESSLTETEIEGSNVDIKSNVVRAIAGTLGVNINQAAEIVHAMIINNNHGYISASILFHLWIRILSKTFGIHGLDSITDKCRKSYESLYESVGAVAVHAIDKVEFALASNITLENNPFSFILFLVDNLQDWERPSISDQEWPIYYLGGFSIKNDKVIELSYIVKHEHWENEIIQRVIGALDDKVNLLNKLMPPKPLLGIKINLSFYADLMHISRQEIFTF